MSKFSAKDHDEHIIKSLEEDAVASDITTQFLQETDTTVEASIIARENGILAGLDLFRRTVELTRERLQITDPVQQKSSFEDGEEITTDERLVKLEGPAKVILSAERVALNYLQQLSGVATLTNDLVEVADSYGVDVCDTRKTVPHLRKLQKYAVRCGGGINHRMDLSRAVMIKDNHKKLAGGLRNYLNNLNTSSPVIVEIHEPSEMKILSDFVSSASNNFEIDIIMLDNFMPSKINEIIGNSPDHFTFEISGGISEENVETYCKTGVDRISSGALTHSFRSLDLSLNMN